MKYEITDQDALYAAFPHLYQEVVIKKLKLNKRMLSHLIKGGASIPGIKVTEE